MQKNNIFILLERLSNLLRNEMRKEGSVYGLQPIQLEALHYLSSCNRYSNTPKGVTEYLGQTKGTVSQSLKILEQKGFITKVVDLDDKRITHLHLTKEGKKILSDSIPPKVFSQIDTILDSGLQEDIAVHLATLLRSLQNVNSMKSFGVCHSCKHFIKKTDSSFFCDLTKEKLSSDDSLLICLEHEIP